MDEDIKSKTQIFDRALLRRRQERLMSYFHNHDYLYQIASEDIYEKVWYIQNSLSFKCGKILILNLRQKQLATQLATLCPDCDFYITSLTNNKLLSDLQNIPNIHYIIADDENLPFASQSFDLVISALNMHLINDPVAFLNYVRKALNPGGWFIANFFGIGSLTNLRRNLLDSEITLKINCSPHIIPFIDIKDATGLMQFSEFTNIVSEAHKVEIEYRDIFKLMQDLKYMGEGNILYQRSKYALSKKLLAYLANNAPQPFKDYFNIISLTGRKAIK